MLSGRFAPSPTGPLHMGSLLAALASYLDIVSRGGSWHLRIDDIDIPREAPGARTQITDALAAHGLHSMSPIRWQSQSTDRFKEALARLSPMTFYCRCSRASLRGEPIYPGTCRDAGFPQGDAALRLRIDDQRSRTFTDGITTPRTIVPATDIGDFIVHRRDQLWAYNFATAVDDGFDFSHVFRGQDLAHTTPMQVLIMEQLKLSVPQYSHMPLLLWDNGDKLSKQTHAPALQINQPAENLSDAFFYLGMTTPKNTSHWTVDKWLVWGLEQWPRHKLPTRLPTFRIKPTLT